MRISKWAGAITISAGFIFSVCGSAASQSQNPDAVEARSAEVAERTGPEVHLSIAPYLWAVSLDGDLGIGGDTFSVEADFIDVLEDSDSIIGLMGRVNLQIDALGFFVDGVYAKIGVDDVPIAAAGKVDVSTEMTFIEFGASWRFAQWNLDEGTDAAAEPDHRTLNLHAYAGGRWTDLEIEVDPAGPSRSRDKEWIDPIVGAAMTVDFTRVINLTLMGDIGGFGAGSEFAWSARAILGFDFHIGTLPTTFYVGYRALGQDYEDDSGLADFEWDAVVHGPMLGFGFHF